jgi:hypothetical protein
MTKKEMEMLGLPEEEEIDCESPEFTALMDGLRKAMDYALLPTGIGRDAEATRTLLILAWALAHEIRRDKESTDAFAALLRTAFKASGGNVIVGLHFAAIMGIGIGYLTAKGLPQQAAKVTLQ